MDNKVVEKLDKTIDDMSAKFAELSAKVCDQMDEKAGKVDEIVKKVADIEAVANSVADATSLVQEMRDLQAKLTAAPSKPGKDEVYEGFGNYVMANFSDVPSQRDRAKKAWETSRFNNTMTGSTNADGGALIPDAFVPELIKLVEDYGIIRNYAKVVPLGTETTTWPKLKSSVTVYAPGSGNSITASAPTFENVSLVPKKLAAYTAIATELVEDSALDIGRLVMEEFAWKLAQTEDQLGFLGDGSDTYFGFVGITGAFKNLTNYTTGAPAGVTLAAGNAYSEITLANIRDVAASLPSYAEANAKWFCSKAFAYGVFHRLAQSANGMTMAEYSEGVLRRFMGYDIVITNVMPSTEANSQLALFFGDLSMGLYMGQRRGMSVATSTEAHFQSDTVALRATERIAFNCFGVGDASNAGPITALVMAAS